LSAVVLQHLHHPQRLLVVAETAAQLAQGGVQRLLAGVPERRVAQIVAQRHRLGQVLVQAQGPGHAAGDARHLQRMREPGAEVVATRRDEHLRLVLQPPERLAVHDPVAVALKRRAQRAVLVGLGQRPPTGVVGAHGERRQRLLLDGLDALCERACDGA